MGGEPRGAHVSVGRAACRACGIHAGSLLALTMGQVLLRLVAFAPVLLFRCFAGNENAPAWLVSVFSVLPAWSGWGLTGLIFLLAVLPLRFHVGEILRRFSAPHLPAWAGKGAYAAWLRAGLLRGIRGLFWGLPFLGALGWFLYAMENMPFNSLGQVFQKFSLLVGKEPVMARGLMVFGGFLLLALLIFWGGWRRDMPMEYLPVRTLGAVGACRFGAKVRLRGRGQLAANTLVNGLLSLPAGLGCLLVLLPYVRAEVRVMSNPLWTLQSLLALLRQPLPAASLYGLTAVLLLLYLPLCVLRKMRNAVLVRRLTRELNDGGGNHAAG